MIAKTTLLCNPLLLLQHSGSKLTYKSVTKSTDDVLKLSTEVLKRVIFLFA